MNAKFKRIVIDGKTYQSIDDMPPDIRQKYERAMRALAGKKDNQIPDSLETLQAFADPDTSDALDMPGEIVTSSTVINNMKIIVDGKEFNRLEDLPLEVRARYEKAMAKLDANGNGIPDFVEGLSNTTNQTTNISTNLEMEPLSTSPAIEPDKSNGWMLAFFGLLLFLVYVAGAAGVWYFFLR